MNAFAAAVMRSSSTSPRHSSNQSLTALTPPRDDTLAVTVVDVDGVADAVDVDGVAAAEDDML